MDNGDPNFDMSSTYSDSYDNSMSNNWAMYGNLALGVGNMIGAVAGMGSNAHHLTKMRQLARQNFAWQKHVYQDQMALTREQMEREDNSMQRKVSDLKKAGLNPVLAAGGSGSPVSTYKVGNAPQQDLTPESMAMQNQYRIQEVLADLYQRFADVSQTRAQIDLIKSQKNKSDEEAKALGIENQYKERLLQGKLRGLDLQNQSLEIANYYAPQLNDANLANAGKRLSLMDAEIKKNEALTSLTKTKEFSEKQEQMLYDLRRSELAGRVSDNYLKMMATAYSLQWYQKHDLPYGSTSQYSVVLGAIDKALSFAESGGLTKSYGIDPDRPGAPGTSLNLRNIDKDNLPGFKDSIFYKLFFGN